MPTPEIPNIDISITTTRRDDIVTRSLLEYSLFYSRAVLRHAVDRNLSFHINDEACLISRRRNKKHVVLREAQVNDGVVVRPPSQKSVCKAIFVAGL